MLFVKHHAYKLIEPENQILSEERRLAKILTYLPESSQMLESLASVSFDMVAWALFILKDQQQAKYYFKLAQRSLVWHLFLCSHPGETFEVDLGLEQKYKLTGKENIKAGIDNSYWILALQMSVVARDMDSVGKLLTVDESLMRRTQLQGAEYYYDYVSFLKSYFSGSKDSGQKLIAVYNSSDVRKVPDDEEVESIKKVFWPQLEMWEALMKNDMRGFNQLLISQLEQYYRTCRDENPDFVPWLISYNLTMFAVIALDRGWELPVMSDYMPIFMLKGEF